MPVWVNLFLAQHFFFCLYLLSSGAHNSGLGEGQDAIVSDFCLCYKENGIQGIQYTITDQTDKGVKGKEA